MKEVCFLNYDAQSRSYLRLKLTLVLNYLKSCYTRFLKILALHLRLLWSFTMKLKAKIYPQRAMNGIAEGKGLRLSRGFTLIPGVI
jgi:hypothetical protein